MRSLEICLLACSDRFPGRTLCDCWPLRNTVLKYLRNILLNMASEDEEIRHIQEKASVARQVLTLLSFLKPFFRVTVEKYTKFLQRIIQAWYLFKSTAIMVSMAKETTGIRPDDTISAYNGGKLNFPWPTENLNFAPRMCMLNWRASPFKSDSLWIPSEIEKIWHNVGKMEPLIFGPYLWYAKNHDKSLRFKSVYIF